MALKDRVKVLDNKAITLNTTGDSDMTYCRGARAVYFMFLSSAAEVFNAASSFQILVRTELNESILAPATASKHGITVKNATDLDGAAANAGIVVTVIPSDPASPFFAIHDIGCRVKAGAANMTDVDCYIFVAY